MPLFIMATIQINSKDSIKIEQVGNIYVVNVYHGDGNSFEYGRYINYDLAMHIAVELFNRII